MKNEELDCYAADRDEVEVKGERSEGVKPE